MTELSERVATGPTVPAQCKYTPVITATTLGSDAEYAEFLRWKADREAEQAAPPVFSGDPEAEEAAWGNVTDEDTPEDIGNIAQFSMVAENPLRFLAFLVDFIGKPPIDNGGPHTSVVFTGEPKPWQMVAALCATEAARDELDRLRVLVASRLALAFPDAGQLEKMMGLYDRGVDVAAVWSDAARRAAGIEQH